MGRKCFPSSYGIGSFLLVSLAFLHGAAVATTLWMGGSRLPLGIIGTMVQTTLGVAAAVAFARQRRGRPSLPALRDLTVAAAILALADAIYGTAFNVLDVTGLVGGPLELIYNVPYAVFWIWLAVAFDRVVRHLSSGMPILLRGGAVALLALLVLGSYGAPLVQNTLPPPNALVHVICLLGKSSVFWGATACLAFSSHRGLQRVVIGFLFIVGYSLLSEYLEMHNKLRVASAGELCWTFGVLAVSLGARDSSWRSERSLTDPRSIRVPMFVSLAFVGLSALSLRELIVSVLRCIRWDVPVTAQVMATAVAMIGVVALTSQFGRQRVYRWLRTTRRSSTKGDPSVRELAWASRSRAPLADRRIVHQFCHDVRAPLTALQVAYKGLAASQPEARELAVAATERFLSLSHSFLEEVRTEGVASITSPFTPQVKSACEDFLHLYPEFSEAFELRMMPGVPRRLFVRWDVSLLLGNLLVNAAEAAGDSKRRHRIRVTVSGGTGNEVILTVEDDCGGLPLPVLHALEGGRSFSTKASGYGLGLLGWKRRLYAMGGSLSVTNDGYGGLGARVRVSLPAASGSGEVQ
jgi:signal transduction histidine kinase